MTNQVTPEATAEDNDELARLLLKDAFTLQSQPGMKEICQHLTDAAIALDECARSIRARSTGSADQG